MKKAFTIIEVIIVVLIIGIVVTLSIPTFQGAARKAKCVAILVSVRRIERECDFYLMERGWSDIYSAKTELNDLANELEDDTFKYFVRFIPFMRPPDFIIEIRVSLKEDIEGPLVAEPPPAICWRSIFPNNTRTWNVVQFHEWAKPLNAVIPK